MTSFADLPQVKPNYTFLLYLQELMQQQDGAISFSTYMQAALYHPVWGYYMQNTREFGKAGDFTTAAELSPLYAECFAKQCIEISQAFSSPWDILELGAGSGRFAVDLLNALKQKAHLPVHYYIYEISPALRQKQQNFIEHTDPSLLAHCIWLEALPSQFTGIIIGNEVLDALPFDCFYVGENKIQERAVTINANQLSWYRRDSKDPAFIEKTRMLAKQYALSQGYQSEISLGLPTFIQQLCRMLQQGMILFSDYGYGEREYYHPLRQEGTLTCFYQHQHHANPFLHPGQEDLTAHVNFTTVAEAAHESGCQLQGYTSQAAFLLGLGLSELVAEKEKQLKPAELLNLHHAIKVLTLPMEMGERVNVMALNKNLDLSLTGFGLYDRRRDL